MHATAQIILVIIDENLFLVAIVIRLVRSFDRHADVVGLHLGERRQLDAEGVEVQSRHLLVEVLRKDVDLLLVRVVVHE